MRKGVLFAAVTSLMFLVAFSVAQGATQPARVPLPEVIDIELPDLDVLVIHLANPVSEESLAATSFRVDNYAGVIKEELDDSGSTIKLQLTRRLDSGAEYHLVLENWQEGQSESHSFTAVETISVETLKEKISSRNTTVELTRNAIAMVEAGHQALLEGRQVIFDTHSELDRAIREFPELELPFAEPDGEFEERMNELVTEAHGQARSALISNRDALVDQVISLEYQREDILTNLAKTKLQSHMAIRQLTLAAETYIFAFHSMSGQLSGLLENLALLQRQLSIVDIQVSLGLTTTDEAKRMSQSALELKNGVTILIQQREAMVAELNLLLGQAHDTPLRIAEPIIDFGALNEEVDFARDLPKVRSGNLTLQSLAADVAQKAKAVARNHSGSPERIIAEYELQNAQIRYAEEERMLTLSFRRLVDDLATKVSSLTLAEEKLALQSVFFGYSELRYELGMISALQLESERLELLSTRRSAEEGRRELLMALHRYRFMLDGLTL